MVAATVGWNSGLNIALGSIELLLGLIVLIQLGRFARTLPWLVVLMAFFLVRGGDRIYVGLEGRERTSITAAVVDGVAISVLVLLLVGLPRTVRALDLLDRESRRRKHEYDRALVDYRSLVRHRLANPLTAITGAIQTLEARPELEADLRAQLLRTVREASERLQDVVLSPQAHSEEERALDAEPNQRRTSAAS
jgi:signal transduction histidine kinase